MSDLQRRLKNYTPCAFILQYTDVLPAPDRPPDQTAVSYSQGCLGNAAMENSWEFPCAELLWGSNTTLGLPRWSRIVLSGHTCDFFLKRRN